jgi:hypothetical protein
MRSELDIYKQQEIAKLRAKYNRDIAALRKTYNNNVAKVRNMRTNSINIRNAIRVLTNQLQNRINALTKKLNADIAKINALQELPFQTIQTAIPEPIPVRPPQKFALLVGINYIGTQYELNGCINDIMNVKNALETKYNYNSANITILTDLTSIKPNKKNIIDSFTNMLQNAISGDYLVFQYSGHGSYIFDQSGDEKDERDETIVPLDLQQITDDEFRNIITANLKPGVKLFGLFDSCHSGTVLDLRYNYFDSENFDNLTINEKMSDTAGQVIMISGCLDIQTSADAGFIIGGKVNYQGAMTNAFLSSLAPNISLKLLLENMRTTLKNNNFTQIPQLSCGRAVDINTELFDI